MTVPTKTYRGYTIEGAGEPGYYFWLNEDTYDGPEGEDHGTERGVAACKRAIDEYLEEAKAAKDADPACWAVGPKGAYCMDNDRGHAMPHYNPLEMWRDE